ncbi:DUF1778 domain-containing protein [Spirillospora albida]|uniref:type II toxin -antitoxin system TacA 1-like antitoxin n=1 Tax=Spirillospora albida TaxID=58123 RepID=UPI000564C470|nr:DUF1778 domain-containing protein [Spirillospora albida]
MTDPVRHNLPAVRPDDPIAFRASAEQCLVIREAAALIGWTVHDYVLSAALDRAERDLYEHAAVRDVRPSHPAPTTTEPYVAVILASG